MMQEKILILVSKENDWLPREMKATGLVDVAQVYHPIGYWGQRLRTLHYHTSFSKDCWYGPWKKTIKNYDKVILFDAFLDSDVAEYIEKVAPKTRLIIFYLNPWFNNYYVSTAARKRCEVWSFDKEDCKKHGLKYNCQFYLSSSVKQKDDPAYSSDLFFVGKDKHRLKLLLNIQNELRKNNLKMCLYVVGERNITYSDKEKTILHHRYMLYSEVLKYNKNAGCLLELMQENQQGFTLRTVEAMFFNKKLVTNNAFLKQYDFYDARNIYILGQDDRNLIEFLKSEQKAAWNPEIVRKYSFENWLANFDR